MSDELRSAEREIDSAFLRNPLTTRSFSESAWYFLAMCEERSIRQWYHSELRGAGAPLAEVAMLADVLITHAKHGLRWLREACPGGMSLPTGYDADAYDAAWKLSEMAHDYLAFESAFTYASMGILQLHIDGDCIIPSRDFRNDTRYEAYDRSVDLLDKNPAAPDLAQLIARLEPHVIVDNTRFSYPMTPLLISQTATLLEPTFARRFTFPNDWELPNYTLGEFGQVARALTAMAMIHSVSRRIAILKGCYGLGYDQALLMRDRDNLVRRLAKYASVDLQRTRHIVQDLTYGSAGLRNPDPALQPLVPLTSSLIAWSPSLLMSSSIERNLLVLMNRVSESREVYARLSQGREQLMRKRFVQELGDQSLGLRFWNGAITEWGKASDVDLAIISDREKHCVLLELKSFIAPAEPREIRDRSQEIAKGIEQVKLRRQCTRDNPEPLQRRLQILSDYKVVWAVASETSVGAAWIQDETVPVVRAGHLIAKLRSQRRLAKVARWLSGETYLPVAGRDFQVVDNILSIGKWRLAWYGLDVPAASQTHE